MKNTFIKYRLLLRENKRLENIIRIMLYPYFRFMYKKSDIEMKKRASLKDNKKSKYDWISELKDKYKGKRCFVIATRTKFNSR